MIEYIVQNISEVSQGNPMIAGALTLAVTGMVGFMFTKLPEKMFNLIKKQVVTELVLNNTDFNKNQTFLEVSKFLHKLTTENGSRTLILDSGWVNGKDIMLLSMGYGTHFFFYKRRFMWLNRTKLDSSGSERMKEEITISVLGRSHNIFRELLRDNNPEEDDNLLVISNYNDKEWRVRAKVPKRKLETLALDTEVKTMFTRELDYFLNNKVTYEKLGLPYKLTMVLHGFPGSGKTSIIRSLASDYNMNICTLSLRGMTDSSFADAVCSVPEGSMIVIEDFDSSAAVMKRVGVAQEGGFPEKPAEGVTNFSMLTLSGVLNTLDGISPLSGNIIMMTTNCLDKIDSAIIRSGRVDRIIELPNISSKSVKGHLEKLYGPLYIEVPSLSAKDVNSLIFKAKNDKAALEKELGRITKE